MSEPVLVDAQITFPTILKPIPNFEQIYQGAPGNTMIAFPGGLDPNSEQQIAGYAPNLQRGISVPFGSRLVIWIPLCPSGGPGGQLPVQRYQYQFVWRLRNVLDFARNRKPYHINQQQPGVPDTTSGTPQDRFLVIPGSQGILYEQAEPPDLVVLGSNIGVGGQGIVHIRDQVFEPRGGTEPGTAYAAPLDASGNPTVVGQGIVDPAGGTGLAGGAIFNVFRCDAEGDELIILATRSPNPTAVPAQSATWNFLDDDFGFATVYGTGGSTHDNMPNLGIYVFSGTNP